MNIAVVDDVKTDRDELVTLIKRYASLNQIRISISEFDSAEDFLESFRSYSFGFVFMDIYMKEMNGAEAAKIIREKDPDVIIIFLTTSDEHMPDAFKVHAFDYIGKPAEKNRIFKLLDECTHSESARFDEPVLSFNANRTQLALPYSSIKIVKTANANYLDIVDRKNISYQTRMTFSAVADELSNDNRFLQIIRGVLVNMDYIIDIFDGKCLLEGDESVPVNVKKSKELSDIWLNYKFAKKRSLQKKRRLE
ncbi:MAG: response regulator transcription factor [Lachnospiraceae bacterium]|nr:response regulator transcription factor [Lachnospiraceae bacterium]